MKKILIPTDFSEGAKQAMKFGVALAHEMQADVVFFHAAFMLIPTTSSPNEYHKQVEKAKFEATVQLKNEVEAIYKSLNIDLSVYEQSCVYDVKFQESATAAIQEAVKENIVDMVVMGTRGASGLKKIFLGSNTSGIMESVKCPVLAVPASYEYKDVTRIAYATDLTKLSKEVAQLVPIAQRFEAKLSIFHVYPVYPMVVNPEKFNQEEALANLKAENNFDDIDFTLIKVFEDNAILDGIDVFVTTHRPDMLVMFTRKRTFFDKIFDSSKTKEMAYNVKVPLLSIKTN